MAARMAIRSNGGGGLPPNVGGNKEASAAKKSEAATRKRRAQAPSADEFERIAESIAGSDDDNPGARDLKKKARAQRHGRIVSHMVSKVTGDVKQLEQEAARILAVLASGGYTVASLERHKRELARIRAKLDKARRQMLKGRRALIEAESGLDEVPESQIARVHHDLDRLERHSTKWGRALAALDMAAELGGGEEPRRLVMRGADKDAALAYAEGANPTTVIADLASSALAMTKGEEAPTKVKADGLGRSLDAMQLLERMIKPGDGE